MFKFNCKHPIDLQYSTFWNDFTYYAMYDQASEDLQSHPAMFADKSLCKIVENNAVNFQQRRERSMAVESFELGHEQGLFFA